tara:strand:- start:100848 stop:101189 length:342 start_codon:yes stop_codon:yes gene_type:complete
MREDLQTRIAKVTARLDKLERLNRLISPARDPREVVADAVLAAAEHITAAAGKLHDDGLVHRIYEEVLASVESSQAMEEVFDRASLRTASTNYDASAEALFRYRVALRKLGKS